MELNEILEISISIGLNLMKYGADVHRVEDTVSRICRAYGVKNVYAFAIRSNLTVTLTDALGNSTTEMRDMRSITYNLDRVERLNALSREICSLTPPYDEVMKKIGEIECCRIYPKYLAALSYAVIALGFSMFFGGGMKEGIAAFIIGIAAGCSDMLLDKIGSGRFFRIILTSALITYVSYFFGNIAAFEPRVVIIGVLMSFVPGISLTNSLRDFLANDYISGIITLIEAILTAGTIAIGVAVAMKIL